MLSLITNNGNSYTISKFSRSFTINEDESIDISASIEISNSSLPMEEFFKTFVTDDKSMINIIKDGNMVVSLEDYEINNSYQEIEDNIWANDNYIISLSKKTASE